jgi:hypothetical protein
MKFLLFSIGVCVMSLYAQDGQDDLARYGQAIELKEGLLRKAAEQAIAQQRTTHFDPIPLVGCTVTAQGNAVLKATGKEQWQVTVKDVPVHYEHAGSRDRVCFKLPQPMNFLEKSTGLLFRVKSGDNVGPHLRLGVAVWSADNDQPLMILADIPVRHKFGDNPHLVYVDWGAFFNYKFSVLREAPRQHFEKVIGFDLMFVARQLPLRPGDPLAPGAGSFAVDQLQLVDIYDGSYDSDRFPKNGVFNRQMIPQGRTQQVARICAAYGGVAGQLSAIRAMDMMAHLQSWDGSWPEGATRLQGEMTYGMIVKDLCYALQALRRAKAPQLREEITVWQWNMEREKLYEQMLYRAALSRSPAPLSTWSDSYFDGTGALGGGCNRPMVFFVSQYVAAQTLSDSLQRTKVLDEYNKNIDELVSWQGRTAGGWPIFGEGSLYGDRGLHYDAPYTMDHVYIMAFAHRITGDERWAQMMRKFDTVVQAMVLGNGVDWDGGLSERHGGQGGASGMKVPDIVFQEALRCNAPYMAQWAYNCSRQLWRNWPQGMWAYTGTAQGYGLGAFLTWNMYDLQLEPKPVDQKIVFPRQWPIWTVQWTDKNTHQPAWTSTVVVDKQGAMTRDLKWEPGQYPVVTGLPLKIVPQDTSVEITAVKFTGQPSALRGGTISAQPQAEASWTKDGCFTATITGTTTISIKTGQAEMVFIAAPIGTTGKVQLECAVVSAP